MIILRYAEARKSLAFTVKKFKVQSWVNFRHKLDSKHRQANNDFWKTIPCLRGATYLTARPIKEHLVVVSNQT